MKTRISRLFNLFRLSEPRSHTAVMMLVFLAIGVTLIFQSDRYYNTPSYANLLDIASYNVWGAAYLLAASVNYASIRLYANRRLLIATHTISIALTSLWLLAFVIRWLTDGGTTIVNVVSWSVFMYLVVRSALMIDSHNRQSGE